MRIDRSSAYRHGMRVRTGPHRTRGILFRCERRDGCGTFWKIRLQGPGETWIWPDDSLIVDGPGEDVAICGSCALPFLREAASGDLICQSCHAHQFPPNRPPTDPADEPAPVPWRGRRMRHF